MIINGVDIYTENIAVQEETQNSESLITEYITFLNELL